MKNSNLKKIAEIAFLGSNDCAELGRPAYTLSPGPARSASLFTLLCVPHSILIVRLLISGPGDAKFGKIPLNLLPKAPRGAVVSGRESRIRSLRGHRRAPKAVTISSIVVCAL